MVGFPGGHKHSLILSSWATVVARAPRDCRQYVSFIGRAYLGTQMICYRGHSTTTRSMARSPGPQPLTDSADKAAARACVSNKPNLFNEASNSLQSPNLRTLTSVASRIERMFKSDSNVPYIVHAQYNDEVDTSRSPAIKKTCHIAVLEVGLRRRKIWTLQVYTICSVCDPAYSKDPMGLVLASYENTRLDSHAKSSTYFPVCPQRRDLFLFGNIWIFSRSPPEVTY